MGKYELDKTITVNRSIWLLHIALEELVNFEDNDSQQDFVLDVLKRYKELIVKDENNEL